MAINVVLNTDSIAVLAPPTSIDLQVGVGERGPQGNLIFFGTQVPNSTFPSSPSIGDIYVRQNPNPIPLTSSSVALGIISFYQFLVVPGGQQWQLVADFEGMILSTYAVAASAVTMSSTAISLSQQVISHSASVFNAQTIALDSSASANLSAISAFNSSASANLSAISAFNSSASANLSAISAFESSASANLSAISAFESSASAYISAASAQFFSGLARIEALSASSNYLTTAYLQFMNLTDVTINNLLNNDTIVYNSASAKWLNQPLPAIPNQLSQSGKYLTTDGTNLSWTDNVATKLYATSASANADVRALSYASSASANADAFSQARDNLKADLASPALTGTPTAPTAAAGTNTTQIATTAFSFDAASSASANINVLALSYASSASANANVLSLSYASSASANANVRALSYATSASANVNVLALSYASSASVNADVRAQSYANNAINEALALSMVLS